MITNILSLGEYFSKNILQEEKQIEIANYIKSQFELQVKSMNEKLTKYYTVYIICLVSFFEWIFISNVSVVNLLPYKAVSPFGLTFRVMFISSLLLFITNKFVVMVTLRRRIKKIELNLTQCLVSKYGNNFNDVLLVVDKKVVKKAFSLLPYRLSIKELVTKFGFRLKVVSI